MGLWINGEGWAATRDASWFNHPDARHGTVVHAATEDWFARCDTRVPLAERSSWPLRDVDAKNRCRRLACSRAFATAGA